MKRIIWIKQTYIIIFNEIIEISIIWRGRNLSNNYDLLFELNCFHYLNHEDNSYASVIDVNFNKILVKNIIETLIILNKWIQLNILTKYNQIECYLIMLDENYKAIENWLKERSWKRQIDITIIMIAIYSVMITEIIINSFKSTFFLFMRTSSAFITSNISWSETSLSINNISQINFNLEHTLLNEIIVYENDSIKIHLSNLIHRY